MQGLPETHWRMDAAALEAAIDESYGPRDELPDDLDAMAWEADCKLRGIEEARSDIAHMRRQGEMAR